MTNVVNEDFSARMNGQRLIAEARRAKKALKASAKFSGAVTVEILRDALGREGIPTSPRDVFIRDIPLEIDLVVPRKGQEPVWAVLYKPEQVAVALEVKNSGCFGQRALKKIKQDFIRCRKRGICCAYVTFEEKRSYCWKATAKRLRAPCFTLAWHKVTGGAFEPTADWGALLKFIRQSTARSADGLRPRQSRCGYQQACSPNGMCPISR